MTGSTGSRCDEVLPVVYYGVKTAISLPDELFAAADALARKLRIPRSRLIANALAEYVARHRAGRVTERLDTVYGTEDGRAEASTRSAARRTLRRADW
jgi:predicted transcriptional regulator